MRFRQFLALLQGRSRHQGAALPVDRDNALDGNRPSSEVGRSGAGLAMASDATLGLSESSSAMHADLAMSRLDSELQSRPTMGQSRQRSSMSYPVQVADEPSNRAVESFRPLVGEILTRARRMSVANVAPVLQQQSRSGGRFGEVAVAMGLIDASDLLWALSQQFGAVQERIGPLTARHQDLIVARQPLSAAAELVRDVRWQLLDGVLNPGELPRSALAVISAKVADGKSYLAANLALSLAQLGGRTVLVDADMRTPRIHTLFGMPDRAAGLSSVLGGSELLRRAIVSLPDMPSLHLLMAGPKQSDPVELLEQPASAVLIQALIREYDYVIVDTPAMSSGMDARVIAQHCGAAMVVARRDRSRMEEVHLLISQLQRSGVVLAGLVMNSHRGAKNREPG